MPLIVTLTFEPAVDLTTSTPRVVPTDKLRCAKPVRDPGGGGINVARVLTTLGGNALAVFPAGGPTGQLLVEMVEAHNVACRVVPMAEGTRRNITVDASETGEQYRFVMPAPVLSRDEAMALVDAAADTLEQDGWLVLGGGVPDAHKDLLAALFEKAKAMDVRVVADTSGAAMDVIRGAWLIKPNHIELAKLAGRDSDGDDAIVAAAHELITKGIAENIVVSRGEDGATLVTRDSHRHYPPIAIEEISAVGAGDSMVAGIVLKAAQGEPLEEAVRYGMAAGAAAAMTPATQLVRAADVADLFAGYPE